MVIHHLCGDRVMKLLWNWKLVLLHAWSVRLMVLAAILSGVEVALPLIDGLFEVPRGIFATLTAVVTIAAFISRFVVQTNIPEK
jgi:hypothetical protein